MRSIPKISTKFPIFIGLFFLLFSLAMACTGIEGQLIEGILQNVDTVNGEITIVTKDGKTITLSITTDDAENSDGSTTSLSSLQAGVPLEIEATESEGGRVARRVKAHLAEIEGIIVGIAGQEITIESSDGKVTVVIVGDDTVIELDGDVLGSIFGLSVGQAVEADFDPDSLVAFKLESEDEDEDDEHDNDDDEDEDEDEDDDEEHDDDDED